MSTTPESLVTLRQELAETEAKASALRRAVKALEEAYANTAGDQVYVQSHDFAHMEIKDAVVKYLGMRGSNDPVSRELLLQDLLRGGCDLGKTPDRYGRTLKTAIRMNSKKPTHPLVYDDKTDTVKLRHGARSARSA